jgi:uncharacterized protein DUF1876
MGTKRMPARATLGRDITAAVRIVRAEAFRNVAGVELEYVIRRRDGLAILKPDDLTTQVVNGHARRNPNDTEDPEIALLVASAMAFEVLARRLRRRADALMGKNERARAHRRAMQEAAERKAQARRAIHPMDRKGGDLGVLHAHWVLRDPGDSDDRAIGQQIHAHPDYDPPHTHLDYNLGAVVR